MGLCADEKVVRRPLKVDLHVHSTASRHKDGAKVSAGTIGNLPVLVRALDNCGVNMVAVTDHDCFDYELYKALRALSLEDNSLQKVLPGVEFSVAFDGDSESKTVHVVTIFDDTDDEALKKLGSCIPWRDDAPAYDREAAFSEGKYWEIIRSIGLSVVTIAHQKATLNSSRKRRNDANSVGERRFNEFLFMDYFEAYEYKNRKNELFNKRYLQGRDIADRLRFITGSDCHQWDAYPGIAADDATDFSFSYLKCLPTFRGLAMAATDASRVKTVDSFFSASTKSLDEIVLEVEGGEQRVQLSPGINAIIGDNSVGKSSIMNSLVDFTGVKAQTKTGQLRYLGNMGVRVVTSVPEENLLVFDGQESIRKMFERMTSGKCRSHLDKHFPSPVDTSLFRDFAAEQIELLCRALADSCDYQELLNKMADVSIPAVGNDPVGPTLSFRGAVPVMDEGPEIRVVSDLKVIEQKIDVLLKNHSSALTGEDRTAVTRARSLFVGIRERHQSAIRKCKIEIKVANALNTVIQSLARSYKQAATDAQKREQAYVDGIDRLSSSIAELVKKEQKLTGFEFDFEPVHIVPHSNPVGALVFVEKTKASIIDPTTMDECLRHVLKARRQINFQTVDRAWLIDSIKNYPDDSHDPIEVMRKKMRDEVDRLLAPVKSIIRNGDDVFEELSQGFNAQLYFSLLRDETLGDGIYFVDQPEDQISQKAIKDVVIGEFREIAESRQVLLITHNPQFLVNLDVDNVIYIGNSGGKLVIQSGALEYECDEYKVLDIVAENVDGGLEAIQRRMKRYEKAN